VTTPYRSSYAVAVSAAIVIKEGPLGGQRVELESELVIGREDASLTVEDPELSRRHAVIRPIDDGVEIEDLGSLNGTFVNDRRIEVPTQVSAGDTIRIGTTVFVVESALASATVASQTPPAPPTPEPPAATPPAPAQTPATVLPTEPFGTYAAPESSRKRRGIASRQLMPFLLSWAAVAATAVALAIYFSQH